MINFLNKGFIENDVYLPSSRELLLSCGGASLTSNTESIFVDESWKTFSVREKDESFIIKVISRRFKSSILPGYQLHWD